MFSTRFAIAIAASLVATAPVTAQEKVPRFEVSPCAIQVPETEKRVECGYVIVPENRTKKNGKTIKLPIAILRSESPNPKPDPVLKTLGGPGGSSLKMIRGRRSSPWLKDRDYIIFEQRGTKYAQPALECPEVDSANIESSRLGLPRKTARQRELAAAKTCFERLKNSGIDLDAYNSAESAADIEDLRRTLKLEKLNLYGVSYSARLMLDVMRYFPAGIRSVVLESTLPPEVNYDEEGLDGIVYSLDQLFASCKASDECAAAYPNLGIPLSGDDFATWIVDYLFSNEPAATVEAPFVIHNAFNGNYAPQFKNYASDKLNGSSYAWGMRYSVWCSEEMPFEKRSAIDSQSVKYPGLKDYEVMALPDICNVWKVRHAKPIANTPVVSNIPTLVLTAQYDAYTPPAWGKSVVGRLENGFYYEVPWAGHGPGFSVPCVGNVIASFIDELNKAPSSECIEKTRSQFKFLVKKT